MGGVIENGGKGISSSLQALRKQNSSAAGYRQAANEQEYQAALAAAEAERKNGYLLQSAGEKMREVYNNYRQTNATQRTQWASSGLRSNSATVQQVLQNNRFQALMEGENIQHALQNSVYENNIAAAEKIRVLQNTAQAYRQAAHKNSSAWKLGTSLLTYLTGR
ncbi:MAG: hypothetical protein MJ053_03805 [Elusimicrobiaceae bacterium]|nr:hypothetical protein [Elusimicrobiaceae bacterium]